MARELEQSGVVLNKIQLFVGIAVLILGLLVYLVDRPPDQTYFVYSSPFNISLFNTFPNIFGLVGYSLPHLFHVFAFILITAALIGQNKQHYIIICLAWLSIETVFEVGQAFRMPASRLVPHFLTKIPFFGNTKNYFLQGTFDPLDLIAAIVGSGLAYFVLLATLKKRRTHEKS